MTIAITSTLRWWQVEPCDASVAPYLPEYRSRYINLALYRCRVYSRPTCAVEVIRVWADRWTAAAAATWAAAAAAAADVRGNDRSWLISTNPRRAGRDSSTPPPRRSHRCRRHSTCVKYTRQRNGAVHTPPRHPLHDALAKLCRGSMCNYCTLHAAVIVRETTA